MRTLTSLAKTLAISLSVCTLAACGGGDGDDSSSNNKRNSPDAQPDVQRYSTTWQEPKCERGDRDFMFVKATGNVAPFERDSMELSGTSGGDMQMIDRTSFYEDANCTVLLGVKEENKSMQFLGKRAYRLGRDQVQGDAYRITSQGGVLRNAITGEQVALSRNFSQRQDYNLAGFFIRADDVDDYLWPDDPDMEVLYIQGDRLFYLDDDDGEPDEVFVRR